jgi:hypothetical protein
MNIFRLAGDMSHVFSILVLLLRLRVAKNAQGMQSCVVLVIKEKREGESSTATSIFKNMFVFRYWRYTSRMSHISPFCRLCFFFIQAFRCARTNSS